MIRSTRRFVLSLALCYFVLAFSVLLALRLPRLEKRELILVLFVRTADNLKEDFTTRYSFCNRFSCFEGVKMAKNACIFLLPSNSGKIYAVF